MTNVQKSTRARIQSLQEALGLKQEELAQLLGANVRTVIRWVIGDTTPTGTAWALFCAIEQRITRDLESSRELKALASSAIRQPHPALYFLERALSALVTLSRIRG